jgi:hypothetical protein
MTNEAALAMMTAVGVRWVSAVNHQHVQASLRGVQTGGCANRTATYNYQVIHHLPQTPLFFRQDRQDSKMLRK